MPSYQWRFKPRPYGTVVPDSTTIAINLNLILMKDVTSLGNNRKTLIGKLQCVRDNKDLNSNFKAAKIYATMIFFRRQLKRGKIFSQQRCIALASFDGLKLSSKYLL